MTTDFHLGAADPNSGGACATGASASASGALAGQRVLVTRPVMPASRTATRLAALGATPLVFPTTIIEPPADRAPLEAALARFGEYYAAIFVSPSAAEMTLAPLGSSAKSLPSSLLVFAPGPGTAEELSLRGVATVQMPETSFDSEGLLALPALQASAVNGKRVAIFRGNDGRELLREELERRGARVDAVTAYHRRPPATSPDGLLELLRAGVDAISAMSSDAVTNLVSLVVPMTSPGERDRLLFAVPLYASHERIADTARAAGFRTIIETAAGDAGLITALLVKK